MNSLQDSFRKGMDLIPALVFMGLNSMIRPIIAPELEKRLGRKLTNLEWQYFLQERGRKSEVDSRRRIVSQWQQWQFDRQIIHDFVWKGEEGESR